MPSGGSRTQDNSQNWKRVSDKESMSKGSARGGQGQRRQGLSLQWAPSEVMVVGPDWQHHYMNGHMSNLHSWCSGWRTQELPPFLCLELL